MESINEEEKQFQQQSHSSSINSMRLDKLSQKIVEAPYHCSPTKYLNDSVSHIQRIPTSQEIEATMLAHKLSTDLDMNDFHSNNPPGAPKQLIPTVLSRFIDLLPVADLSSFSEHTRVLFNNLVLASILGKGTFAIVLELVDVRKFTPYALKIYFNASEGKPLDNKKLFQEELKYVEEAKQLIASFPNLMIEQKFIDQLRMRKNFSEQEESPLLPGKTYGYLMKRGLFTLEDLNKEGGKRWNLQDIKWLFTNSFDKLCKLPFLHNDVKLNNVLVVSQEQIALMYCDFNAAGSESDIGTPEYCAPERRKSGFKPNEKSDIYSWGIMMKKLLKNCDEEAKCTPYYTRIEKFLLKCTDPAPENRADRNKIREFIVNGLNHSFPKVADYKFDPYLPPNQKKEDDLDTQSKFKLYQELNSKKLVETSLLISDTKGNLKKTTQAGKIPKTKKGSPSKIQNITYEAQSIEGNPLLQHHYRWLKLMSEDITFINLCFLSILRKENPILYISDHPTLYFWFIPFVVESACFIHQDEFKFIGKLSDNNLETEKVVYDLASFGLKLSLDPDFNYPEFQQLRKEEAANKTLETVLQKYSKIYPHRSLGDQSTAPYYQLDKYLGIWLSILKLSEGNFVKEEEEGCKFVLQLLEENLLLVNVLKLFNWMIQESLKHIELRVICNILCNGESAYWKYIELQCSKNHDESGGNVKDSRGPERKLFRKAIKEKCQILGFLPLFMTLATVRAKPMEKSGYEKLSSLQDQIRNFMKTNIGECPRKHICPCKSIPDLSPVVVRPVDNRLNGKKEFIRNAHVSEKRKVQQGEKCKKFQGVDSDSD
jgi:serine/threonine protein kinase